MSTTFSPLTWRAKAAPTSPWRSKLAAKASPTPSKPGAISPSTVTTGSGLGGGGLVGAKLTSGDGALVHLIGSVGEAQGAGVGPHGGEGEVAADAAAAVSLDGAVDDVQRHAGGDDLDG